MSATADPLRPSSQGGGVDGLILFLREKGFAVGASEALDAARLVAHLARTDPNPRERRDPAWLMPKLRPVLCKRSEDQERFEALYRDWSQFAPYPRRGAAPKAATPAPTAQALPPPPAAGRWRIAAVLALVAVAIVLVLDPWGWRPQRPAPVPIPQQPSMPATTAKPAPAPATAPAPAQQERFQGYFPAVRYNRELRPWAASALLGLGGLGVLGLAVPLTLPWLGHARLSGRRIPLDLASLREEAKRIVPPLQADTQARLERHVAGPAALRERLQRRPPLHLRRTVEATLRNLGVLSLRYRAARLRPSYLLIVEVDAAPGGKPAEILSDPRGRMFYRWAERLRQQGIDVDIRLARFDPATGTALTCRPAGGDWRLDGAEGEPLDRLPTPPVGQRLVVVSDGGLLVDELGNWRDWATRARLHRWPQRALFTPTEPRHWGKREDALERRERPADPGFYVLPLDESALAAWAELVVTGRLPRFTLSRAQRYPKRLRALEDANQVDALLDPATPVEGLPELLDQLKYYLGENAYYWLCACAVPPIVRWELTLLLGEQYYRNAGVAAEELPDYIARDYPRLALLPWLRRQRMPDWLRLALLDSLSPRVQEEVREVVRGKLGQLRLDAAGDDSLGLEEPPGPLGGGGRRRPAAADSDTLYLGYLAGHTPRQLMLRAPREWRGWLARLPARQRAGLLADWLAALRDRLLWRSGLSFFGASRRALGLAALALTGLAALVAALTLGDAEALPPGLRDAVYAERGRAVAYPHAQAVNTVTVAPHGRRVLTASDDGTARLWDPRTGAPLGSPMTHAGPVTQASFSGDGQRVLTASEDGTARLWDATTGNPRGAPMRHQDRVNQAIFSPDGLRVVTASEDGTARLWDAATGAALGEPMELEGPVIRARFSPDGGRVITASQDGAAHGSARLWDAQTSAALGVTLPLLGTVRDASFSPDGRRIVTTTAIGGPTTARLWDAQTASPVGSPIEGGSTLAFSPDGRRLLVGGELRDATTGAPAGMLEAFSTFKHAAFSPDGRWIATASSDTTARLWDARTGLPVGGPMWHENVVTNVAFSPDGRHLLTASWDGRALRWEATPAAPAAPPLEHRGVVWHAAFSPDGRRVVTASGDGTARLWDTETGAAIGTPMQHKDLVYDAAFSPDGRRIVTASGDDTARLWNADTGAAEGTLQHEAAVLRAAFSPPDGRRILTISGAVARLWDVGSGATLGALMAHQSWIYHAAFSPDGRRIVTASLDRSARLWDAETGTPLGAPMMHPRTVYHAAFDPDGRRVVTTCGDGTARVWDVATGAQVGATTKHSEMVVWQAAFDRDGRRLVTASEDGTARLWDANTGAPMGTPMKHDGAVYRAAFSPDGRQILTASADRSVRLWDPETGAALAAFPHDGEVKHAAFSPDGTRLVAAWGRLAPAGQDPPRPAAPPPQQQDQAPAESATPDKGPPIWQQSPPLPATPEQSAPAKGEPRSRGPSPLEQAMATLVGEARAASQKPVGGTGPAAGEAASDTLGGSPALDVDTLARKRALDKAQQQEDVMRAVAGSAGGAVIWRVPPHPLPAPGPWAPVGRWWGPAGLGALGLFAAWELLRAALARRALLRLAGEGGA